MSAKLRIATEVVRIGSIMLWERLSGMRPTRPPSIPPTFEALTREWLTATLCDAHPGAEVVDFILEDGSSGSTVREMVRLDYNDAGRGAGLPERVFAKSTARFTTRMAAGLAGASYKEVMFYNRLRQELDIEAPESYFGGIELPSQRSMVLLKDMSDCTFTDPTFYINRDETEEMVALLASLHARFWDSSRFKSDLSWLGTALDYLQLVDDLLSFWTNCEKGIDRAASVIPQQMLARRTELKAATWRATELNGNAPITFLHHDVHIGNWYKTAEGRMGLGDWQCLVRGNWASDFSYAITSALTVADRRAWEKELLALYLENLRSAGVSNVPDFDSAWLLYRQQIFHALSFWLSTIGVGVLQPDMQPDSFSMLNIERFANAVVDLDSLDSLR